MTLPFLKKFRNKIEKIESITTDFGPPKKWISTGNLALNKRLSGSFLKGIPLGRITGLAGPSGTGKSFLLCNILKNAQKEVGAFVLVLDSENALDDAFMSGVGVNTSPQNLQYVGVTLFSDVVKSASEFISLYVEEFGYDNPDAPVVIICLDSVDQLLTDSETDHFDKGVQKGDQGQQRKQAKHMMKTILSRIKRLPIAMIFTHQVYPNNDLLNGEGLWIVNNALRYSPSQIALITKLNLKEGSDVIGIRMRVQTYKSRFAQVGSKVEIEVPYTTGMDPYSGFLDIMEEKGVVTSAGAWKSFTLPDGQVQKFQEKNLTDELVAKMLLHPTIASEEKMINEMIETMSDLETSLNDDRDGEE